MKTPISPPGNGIDVSKKRVLQKAQHVYIEPNNFYTLREKFKHENLDFIYAKNIINSTKFHKILLKEWFDFVKIGGEIIIELTDNELLDFIELENDIQLLLGNKIEVSHKETTLNGGIIVIKKTKSSLNKKDSINKWSFGILSDGSRIDALEKQIQSIIDLRIPSFEIIICGPYNVPKKWKTFVKVIPFKDKVAWITKKKNLIVKKAKYENLIITHNRFTFDENWHKGMKKYGNYFEVLMCKIHNPSGKRSGDWLSKGMDIKERWYDWIGLMEYKDWDNNLMINGGLHILKKDVAKRCPWDEALIWGQAEDDAISYDFHKAGFVPRFNKYSLVYTFAEKNWKWKYSFNSQKLGRIPFNFSVAYFKKKLNYLSRKYLGVGFVVKEDCKTYGW